MSSNATLKVGRTIAAASAAAAIVSAVVVASATIVGGQLIKMQTANAATVQTGSEGKLVINRSGKGDKLPVNDTAQTRHEIKSVEVVGIRGAAIVYRDRNGNVLFRTDPVDNVTVVTKNVELPEVTVRASDGAEVERVPVEEAGPSAPPHGCESAFAKPAPESLTRLSNRCVTEITPARRFAAVN